MPALRPSDTTKRKILAACGNQCAHPDCDELIIDLEHETIIGKIAHIKGRMSGSARYDPSQNDEERNSFSNLIALCGKHHDIVDKNPDQYSSELLYKWKQEHEEKVANLQDRNWIGFPSSIVRMEPDGTSLSLHCWVDRNGRPRIYTKEQLAICYTLLDFFKLIHGVHDFLGVIDQINHESQIPWLKQQVKSLKLNEYGFFGSVHEIFQIAQDIKFGEYTIFAVKDGRIKKAEIAERGRIALQEKADSLPDNPSFKK